MTNPPNPKGRRTGLIIAIAGCACLLLLALALVAVIAGVFTLHGNGSEDGDAADPRPVDSSEAPPNTSAATPALLFGEEGEAPVVDVYLDYSCPHCADFAETNDEDLQGLAESGEATIRIHPLPMLNSPSAGYSERAASAATCVNANDPDLFWDMSDVLFKNQADGPTLDSADIAELASGVGAGQESLECIEGETYVGWVNDTVHPEALTRITGTPQIFIDDELWEGDWSQSGTLVEAISTS